MERNAARINMSQRTMPLYMRTREVLSVRHLSRDLRALADLSKGASQVAYESTSQVP